MPASLPPSALPSRQSPSRPADASSEFVVPEASPAEVKGSEPSAPAVGSGASMEESVERKSTRGGTSMDCVKGQIEQLDDWCRGYEIVMDE